MCDPMTAMLAAATAMKVAGQGLSALSAASSHRYEAKIADRNAELENEAGRNAAENGQLEAARQYRKLGQLQGRQAAAMAANGVDSSFGSALQVQSDTAAIGAEDIDSIYRQTHQAVRGFDINSSNSRAQAKAKRRAASGDLWKGAFDIGSTLLSSATQFGNMKSSGAG
jgi:hypothetical protein